MRIVWFEQWYLKGEVEKFYNFIDIFCKKNYKKDYSWLTHGYIMRRNEIMSKILFMNVIQNKGGATNDIIKIIKKLVFGWKFFIQYIR